MRACVCERLLIVTPARDGRGALVVGRPSGAHALPLQARKCYVAALEGAWWYALRQGIPCTMWDEALAGSGRASGALVAPENRNELLCMYLK